MGWEQRGSNKYYYRKEREGSRVKSVYVGRGKIAHMVSDLQDTSGLFEKAIGVAYPTGLERLKAQDAKLDEACGLINAMMQASLLAAGSLGRSPSRV
jgi:hypothetical protein